ncbi:hypothetical protein [Roseomonas sp. CECT 9278]|uniref:hypothetical protein n=1 Tax=Roseomonas sp. CECT 9278 TaxID=2845823 RepID=UPI001E44DD33|nr:hypothetical protein [Roseomonas sp. CECT 9278]CAH0223785.1 hypothetical protein ROS9278_02474 [Roseomonas sp. CECT 9278]
MSTGDHIAPQPIAAPSRPRRRAIIGIGVGLAALGIVAGIGALRGGSASASAAADPLAARVARLEATIAAARDEPRPAPAPVAAAQRADRFIAAALLLQSAIATPRPWLREYQVMVALAPTGALPAPLAEVLLSHAGRGLPTEAELRERFVSLAPQLAARAPRQGDAIDQTFSALRGAVAGIGLAAPPAPSDQEQAIAGVVQQLRRGNLAAAVADASALAPSLQPLLVGWLAQASARLAVEQAVQETLLRALMSQAPPA